MIYSKTCEYAVRALAYLALKQKGGFTSCAQVSEETGVPGPYITKIFQCLVQQGILISRSGVNGGVAFLKDPEDLRLMDIVKAIDDLDPLSECLMGLDTCNENNGCPLHAIWKKAKAELILKLENTTLYEINAGEAKDQYRNLKRSKLKKVV